MRSEGYGEEPNILIYIPIIGGTGILMSDKQEYRGKRQTTVTLTGGDVFVIKPMSGRVTVALLGMLPKEGVQGSNLQEFVTNHYDDLVEKCVKPCVISPNLEGDDYLLMDVIELLSHMMDISGLNQKENEKRDEFRKEPDVVNTG